MDFTETQEENVDYLEVDAPVPGQNYCCMSFISPENVLVQKDQFIMKKFIESLSDTNGDVKIKLSDFDNTYSDFVSMKSQELDEAFHKEAGFQTSMRGIKVRGVYNTYEEAAKRAAHLQRLDRAFHVFVGQVGYWLPWDPSADTIGEQEYMEKQLNDLMKNYKSNQVQRDIFYSSQVEEHKKNVIAAIAKKKKETENATVEVMNEMD